LKQSVGSTASYAKFCRGLLISSSYDFWTISCTLVLNEINFLFKSQRKHIDWNACQCCHYIISIFHVMENMKFGDCIAVKEIHIAISINTEIFTG
jgi:hypothetical protein